MPTKDTQNAIYHLVVIRPFGDYQRGDKITDPDKVAEILNSENADFCNKIEAK